MSGWPANSHHIGGWLKGFTTKALHGRTKKKDVHGALRTPVYDTVAFEYESGVEIQRAFEGKKASHSYSRVSNPTIEELEQRVALLTDAAGVIAVSSGMAAISDVILVLAGAGTNIVTSRFLFGNTTSLFEHTLKPWGLETRYVDLRSPDEVAGAIDGQTRAVFLETITNPQLQVFDVARIAEIAHERNVPVVADGTMTTPVLFRSKDFGVDVEIYSSTKYMSGGGTAVGGLIVDNGIFPWEQHPKLAAWGEAAGPFALLTALRREVYRNTGSCLAPHNAYLHTLGLETLELRVRKSCDNALALARWLEGRDEVAFVNYPGLESSPYHAHAKAQLTGGFGGVLTFGLPRREDSFGLMDRLRLIRRATNINDNKTLILHPASTIFCEYSPEERARMDVGENLLRLSVGIEDLEDLTDDLAAALK